MTGHQPCNYAGSLNLVALPPHQPNPDTLRYPHDLARNLT